MGVKLVAFYHVEWNGAMGKEQFAADRIDVGGVSLEARKTCDGTA